MEFIAILLSGLISLISPAGIILDRVAADAIRDRLDSVESLQVRIDNAPSYQLLRGRVDRVRIAGRGVFPIAGVRIAAVEVETDAIALNPHSLRQGHPVLEQPLQAGVRLVLSREDLNQALQSPEVTERLRNLSLNLLGTSQAQRFARYDFMNPQVDFLPNNRLRLQVMLQEQETDRQLVIAAESGLEIVSGQQLQLVEPTVTVNEVTVPALFVRQLAAGINRRLNLQQFEAAGITARVLQLEVKPEELAIAVFVRVDPSVTASGN